MDYEKTGYLTEDFKYFYIKDRSDRVFDHHYHDFYKIILFVKGDVTYNVEGKSYELKPWDFILVGKNEIHRPIVNPDVEYERLVVYLSDSFLRKKVSDEFNLFDCFTKCSEAHINVVRFSTQETLRLKDMLKNAMDTHDSSIFGAKALSELYLTEFLIKINDSIINNGIDYNGKVEYNEKVVAVTEYINSHLGEDLSVEKISDLFFLSRYHLMRLFKECTGYTIHQYITEKRLIYVRHLTDEGMKVKDACVKAGFSDYAMYFRARKKHGLKE